MSGRAGARPLAADTHSELRPSHRDGQGWLQGGQRSHQGVSAQGEGASPLRQAGLYFLELIYIYIYLTDVWGTPTLETVPPGRAD